MTHKLQKNKFAVIGNPVDHSLSPMIHQTFARQFDVALSYEKILTDPSNFQKVVKQFFSEGGRGLNVTTPFKSDAAEMVDSISIVAKKSNSVNTLYIDEKSGQLMGDSTDGRGWLVDVRRLDITLKNSSILVIGAGGAARIIINQLLSESAQFIHLCNRTEARSQELANEKITASGFSNLPDMDWDLIINTLPVGWHGNYPEIKVRISNTTTAYDLNYGKGALAFRQWFVDRGGEQVLFYDGWGMLVEQAAASFSLWWQKKPRTDELIQKGNS